MTVAIPEPVVFVVFVHGLGVDMAREHLFRADGPFR